MLIVTLRSVNKRRHSASIRLEIERKENTESCVQINIKMHTQNSEAQPAWLKDSKLQLWNNAPNRGLIFVEGLRSIVLFLSSSV